MVNTMTSIRTYSEMLRFDTFEDRFKYLKLGGGVGRATFGFDRFINQNFYNSRHWEDVRREVILRDNGCDLAVPGYEIEVGGLVHHMNPITPDDILHAEIWITDPEFLILTTHRTHNNIHFGTEKSLPRVVARRMPGDTRLW